MAGHDVATLVAVILYSLHSVAITIILTNSYMLRTANLLDVGSPRPFGETPRGLPVRSIALFTDPQSVTINAVATSLPKTSVNGSSSVYTSADGAVTMTVSHQRDKRKRSVVRLDQKKTAADPLLADRNVESSQSVYLVVNAPLNGVFSNAEQKYLIDALTGFLTASSGAATTKFVAGES